jgi:hypothetical protein
MNKKDKTESVSSYVEARPPFTFLYLFSVLTSTVLSAAGLAGVAFGIYLLRREDAGTGFWLTICSLALMGLGAIIYILGWLTRLQAHANQSHEAFTRILSRDIQTTSQPTEQLTKDLEAVKSLMTEDIVLLRDINENLLLDEAGRKRKIEFLAEQERKRIFAEVEDLIKEKDWAKVRVLLTTLADKYPGNTAIRDHISTMETLRKAAFADEFLHTKKIVHDLIAISAWERATHMADILVERHPDQASAKELAAHVCTERVRFREEQIKRMHADIERSIGKKRWNDALQVSQQLIEKYPDSVEAETLRLQMATMETNAEIEKRQELEEQIKDLVKRRNFIQAVELARYVIDQYPSSPQATALRGQLEKLEELAQQQEKEIKL